MRKISRRFTWRERFRVVGDIFNGIFNRQKELEKLGMKNFDLTKVPEKEVTCSIDMLSLVSD